MVATPSNALNITATGLVKFDGTATFSATTTTIHDVLIGAASNGITNVAPSATSGVALISQGAAADPAFGTVVVAGGGTGAVTLTGILTGNGTSAVTASTVTQHGVLVGGASNAVSSTAVGSTGQVLQANSAADPTYSTATYPSVATGTGTILRADGTNWSATTATYPNTTGATTFLTSTSANVITTDTYVAYTTFTPALAFGGSSTGITYSVQLGTYVKIGRLVCFSIYLNLTSKGAQTGAATITGLPFTSANDTMQYDFPSFATAITAASATFYYSQLAASSTTLALGFNIASTGTAIGLTNTAFANNSQWNINGSYMST